MCIILHLYDESDSPLSSTGTTLDVNDLRTGATIGPNAAIPAPKYAKKNLDYSARHE